MNSTIKATWDKSNDSKRKEKKIDRCIFVILNLNKIS